MVDSVAFGTAWTADNQWNHQSCPEIKLHIYASSGDSLVFSEGSYHFRYLQYTFIHVPSIYPAGGHRNKTYLCPETKANFS